MGGKFLLGKIGLAPMAGITDFLFRKICFKHNAVFAFTENDKCKKYIKEESSK